MSSYELISNLPRIKKDFSPLSTKSQCISSQIRAIPNDLFYGFYSLEKIMENFLWLLNKKIRYDRFGQWDYNGNNLEKVNSKERFEKRKEIGRNSKRWFQNTLYHTPFGPREGRGSWSQRREWGSDVAEAMLIYLLKLTWFSLRVQVTSPFLSSFNGLGTTDLWKCYLDLLRLFIFFFYF